MEEMISELKDVKTHLERQVAELRAKAEQIERRATELRQAEEKKHAEEIDFLKKTNQQLKVYYVMYIAVNVVRSPVAPNWPARATPPVL